MSTRAAIGIQNSDGTIKSITVNNDGYPEYTGEILARHYADETTINRLVDLGDLSVIGITHQSVTGHEPLVLDADGHYTKCKSYHVIDGDPIRIRANADAGEYLADSYRRGLDYAYLYAGEEWHVYGYDAMRDAMLEYGKRIDLTDIGDIETHFDTVKDVARHEGGTLDLDTILALRQATRIEAIDYDMYARLNSQYADLFDRIQNILDGRDDNLRDMLIRDTIRLIQEKAWRQGLEAGYARRDAGQPLDGTNAPHGKERP